MDASVVSLAALALLRTLARSSYWLAAFSQCRFRSTEQEGDEEEMLMPHTDLSAGSISEQLASNAQFSLDASDFNLADGLDDLDDLD
jgi:hypothetical protein